MGNSERGGFIPEQEHEDPVELAMKKWGVDLNDYQAVLNKIYSLQGKMPDVSDLSNLWMDSEKKKKEETKKAA